MSNFRVIRTSELKTAPDVRERRKLSKANHSLIPVLERRRMFEEVDSGEKYGGSNTRRGSRLSTRKDITRSSSLRSSKRLKTDDGSPLLKNKQLSQNALPLWQRLKNFGHYDTQSMTLDSLQGSSDHSAATTAKKPTGASAAAQEDGSNTSEDVSNILVAPCPTFKNEIGGDDDWLPEESPAMILREQLSHDKQKRVGSRQRLILDGDIPLKDLVATRGPMSQQVSDMLQEQKSLHFPLEFLDYGASYYRHYFLGQDHQNFFGVDETLGPVAISLKRERVPPEVCDFYNIQPSMPNNITMVPKHQWRIIFRTGQLTVLRGAVLEESIPTSSKMGTNKGIPPRDVVDYITQGEIPLSVLKQGKNDKKVVNELVRLDEQELNNKYKIGVMYCKPGQTTEEEMYNNETGSPALDELMEHLGEKVKMKGFSKYRAQLDNKTDTTGEYSVYTDFRDTEMMFHVSTMLPYTSTNKQQLLRKRHIGNDIVTLVFQEPGCEQFSAKCIRSHFQHIFIVVRVVDPNTEHTKYRVSVSRSQDIPFFGPTIPEDAAFDKNEIFREFMLTKLVNACNASLRSDKFSKMAVRTRKQYLHDLAECTTALTLDQVSTGRVAGLLRNLSHRKLRERGRQESTLLFTPGALTWPVKLLLRSGKPLPFSEDPDYVLECAMGMAPDFLAFMDSDTQEMLLHVPMMHVTGWIQDKTRINLFYDDSYCLSLECYETNEDDCADIWNRLHSLAPKLTLSHEATLMEFPRGPNGLLGFGINEVGVVQKVDGLARSVGLQKNSRLLQVEDRLLCCHSHKQIMEVLTDRKRPFVKAYVVPPPPDKIRPVQYYPALHWAEIWSARPSHADSEEGKNHNGAGTPTQNGNGTTTPEPLDSVTFRQHSRAVSNSNRMSYMEAMQSGDYVGPIDDSEPIYDRLRDRDNIMSSIGKPNSPPLPRSRSPSMGTRSKHDDRMGYSRVNRKMKPNRESVVPFAKHFKKNPNPPESEPMDASVEEYSPGVQARVSSSTKISEHKSHTATPLTDKYPNRRAPTRKPNIEINSPGINELSKRFSYGSQSTTSPGGRSGSKIPVANVPLKATTSASEMTKSPSSLPVKQNKPINGFESGVKLRNGISSGRGRPNSWDFTSSVDNKVEDVFVTRDDSAPHTRADIEAAESFHRNSNIRSAFRRKSASRELSPEPGELDQEFSPTQLLSPYSDQKPDSPKLSQGSNSSQGSGPPMTVRERTIKWESRGGGVPSYFSTTLPKSFRHKATDMIPSGIPSPTTSLSITSPRRAPVDRTLSSSSGIPQPTIRSPSSSVSSEPRIYSRKASQSREEADGSSNPDETFEGKSKGSRQLKTKTVVVKVKTNRKGSRDNLQPPKTTRPSAQQSSNHDSEPVSSNGVYQSGVQSDLQSLSLSDKTSVSNGGIGYKPRVEEWVRQTSQTALPLESTAEPPREITSPTPTDSSLNYSQLSDLSQSERDKIDSLKARVDFLEGQLEKETENKKDLAEKLKSVEMHLNSMQNKKRLKIVKTAMI